MRRARATSGSTCSPRGARPRCTTERERAALAWTEAVTPVTEAHVSDDVYAEVSPHFSEEELVWLTLAVVAINGFNRLNVAFRTEAGGYEPGCSPTSRRRSDAAACRPASLAARIAAR